MTKNEIVARFMGFSPVNKYPQAGVTEGPSPILIKNLKYDSDWNKLQEAWRKFRDLQYTDGDGGMHEHIKSCIITKIVYGTITEAFDELCKGIEWYNSLNEKV